MNLINKLPITKIKITLAFFLYKTVSIFKGKNKKKVKKTVKGITYELDLKEGLDLSMYLFGGFQKHVTNSSLINISEYDTIFDVGGNFGFMALQYAKKSGNATIFSFEPTHYAISKFKRNLELNPDLSDRINIINTYISDKPSEKSNIQAFSSWRVDTINNKDKKRHSVHLGIEKSADGVKTTTLDRFCHKNNINKVDFIKIDTDGHEPFVLKGATKLITENRPTIIFEIGKYVMTEKGIDFNFYLDFFNEKSYQLFNAKSEKIINKSNWEDIIPNLGTIDVVAIPEKA
ncbi:MAG: hypothetical protein CSA05_00730 [Bacteroidia bacterium]|nr:MAG: hypothetical protein CSA05_00730 [Bacteroidia bacterium]